MPVTLVFRRPRQDDCEFKATLRHHESEASLGYMVRSCLQTTTEFWGRGKKEGRESRPVKRKEVISCGGGQELS
jgi:hypothetical protein